MTENALALHDAFVRGDIDAVRRLLGDPPEFPSCPLPPGYGERPLGYAVYHAPLSAVRQLLEGGADPRFDDPGGFPPLFAALTCERSDHIERLRLLLDHGADPAQRGVNDWTALHLAVSRDDPGAVRLLLERGADPHARTRIDDQTSPIQDAEVLGRAAILEILRGARPTPDSRGRRAGRR